MLPSGPSYPLQNFQRLVVAALHASRDQVTITTPYLIPDEELLHSLETAVLGGVKIRLVVPEKGDQFLVGSAAKAYFSAFLAMGVEIWLYQEDPPRQDHDRGRQSRLSGDEQLRHPLLRPELRAEPYPLRRGGISLNPGRPGEIHRFLPEAQGRNGAA
ncbi:hypothetical protein MASR2M79_13850 [Aminivibrio sp.]